MKLFYTVSCFFFLSLQDGNTVTEIIVYSEVEGGDVTVQCSFSSSGNSAFFCKETCKEKNVLIKTTGVRGHQGRYSIKHNRGDVDVTITQLNKSDSGRYRCGVGRSLWSSSYQQIEIIVTDAQLSGNRDEINVLHKRTGTNITVECSFSSTRSWKFFCKEPCEDEKNVLVETNDFSAQRGRYSIRYLRGNPTEGSVFVTITQLTESDSGRYRCGLEGSYRGFELMVTDARFTSTTAQSLETSGRFTPLSALPQITEQLTDTNTEGVWLLVIVTVVIIVLVLSVVVLILCRKRFHKSSGSQNTGNSRGTNKEVSLYENCPDSKSEDSTYLSLHPATRDQNQTYATLRPTQRT
ncbi:polymeric immunoglobulin receptor-like isoform X2 [Anabas testudineus]|uniref:polymeric immunoglobulin receptor-like isoform X2 n=1 Tax=Anabas testudineus TaxID=64144 RepID=UPI000E45CE20|nr:polymeric immunoglobulin receptor-like isoform X2 [Anabas testudineus]